MEVPEQKLLNVQAAAREFIRWIEDQVLYGLAALESDPYGRIEQIAAQLTDQQLPGPAAALRAWIPKIGVFEDWAEGFAQELGYWYSQCKLIAKTDQLNPIVVEGLLVNFGHRVRKSTLTETGHPEADTWTCTGIENGEEKNVYYQRVYWRGTEPDHVALQLDFNYGSPVLATITSIGASGYFSVVSYPGGLPNRALFPERKRTSAAEEAPHHFANFAIQQRYHEQLVARQPWRREFDIAVGPVFIKVVNDLVEIADDLGQAMHILAGVRDDEAWKLAALAAGKTSVIYGVLRNGSLVPHSVWLEGKLYGLTDELG